MEDLEFNPKMLFYRMLDTLDHYQTMINELKQQLGRMQARKNEVEVPGDIHAIESNSNIR